MTLLKAFGVALTLVVIAASAWMNFEFMTGEGSGRAAVILGIISVAFDLIMALLPIVIAAALVANARCAHSGEGDHVFRSMATT